MFFETLKNDNQTKARTGIIHTDHGDIETPAFMPVGTQATVKTLDQQDLLDIGAQIILGNTYHLHLRPGEDLIAGQGGLHKFMNWNKPILTDSGGFQVFSLGLQKKESGQGGLTKIDEDGVTFQSHIDGSSHRFNAEIAIDIQHKLGADIIMAFDECTPDTAPHEYIEEAMERTHRWAKRCLTEHQKNTSYHGYRQFLFGIIQGAGDEELRKKSAQFISSLPFDGIAIGGESIGYNMEATKNILDWVVPIIPENKPRYTMGLGLSPLDLLEAVEHGADMFDCVAPTRLARHGMLFVFDKEKEHRLNIKNAKFENDLSPIDPKCSCPTCKNYTRSYLHHLFSADEMTGMRLATIHNLYFMLNLMKETREAINKDEFTKLLNDWKTA
ncbi:MAG TPA: tRNA guanosine(34) transglycosylase Tgt [Candidatus Magasanikbacteria bacterium]|nr:tRNA guanosine(34) transglycosylase Tgt [Candidatus Magasanikbacteria bacterium]